MKDSYCCEVIPLPEFSQPNRTKTTFLLTRSCAYRDILHPGRANISKEELREKLGGMYKAQKDQVNVFGLRTQYGGGKTTGFALVYDSPEAMVKFEPRYRLVRVGKATKVERAARQQRTCPPFPRLLSTHRRLSAASFGRDERDDCTTVKQLTNMHRTNRQAAQEPPKDPPWNGKGQGCQAQEGEISAYFYCVAVKTEGHGGYYWGASTVLDILWIWIGEYWHVLPGMNGGFTITRVF